MSRTLLVLGASTYQLETIRTARELGYRVVTADNVPTNPGHKLADRSYCVDTSQRDDILDVARREHVCGVISPGTDVGVPTAARVAQRLGLRGVPEAAAETLCDKLRFRDFLRQRAFPHPESHRFSRACAVRDSLFDGSRWIMKPDCSSGSKGVFIVDSADEFERRAPETLEFSPTGTGVVERFIEGFQGTCEGILHDGRPVVTWVLDRQTVAPPYVATCGHHVPTRLPSGLQARLFALLERAWALLDVRNGPFDCDFVSTSDEVFILEMTPRLGGNSIAPLLRRASHFDLVAWAVRWACGDAPDIPADLVIRPSAVVLLGVAAAGRLQYNQAEAIRLAREPWVDSLAWDVAPDTPVKPFIHGRHRVGQCFVYGADRDELDARVSDLRERLDVKAN